MVYWIKITNTIDMMMHQGVVYLLTNCILGFATYQCFRHSDNSSRHLDLPLWISHAVVIARAQQAWSGRTDIRFSEETGRHSTWSWSSPHWPGTAPTKHRVDIRTLFRPVSVFAARIAAYCKNSCLLIKGSWGTVSFSVCYE